MSRFRVGLAVMAMITALAVPVISAGGGVATAVPSMLGPCNGDLTGAIFTLTGPCTTTGQINVPSTITTVSGGTAKNTITAEDTTPGSFSGAVLNSTGATMNVENLNIVGHFTFGGCIRSSLYGILFNNASGTVKSVTVTGITENSGCQVGTAIRANGLASPMHTVTITNTTVSLYDKNGLTGSGAFMTMNVSNSTIGPPASLVGVIAQNGVQWGGANAGTQGSITNSKIYGSGDDVQGPDASGVAVLLFGAKNVTVSDNTLTGAGTDDGIFVTDGSTGIVISHNAVGRTSADSPDPDGVGIVVCSSNSTQLVALCATQTTFSSATLVCNTFTMWKHNIVGAVQITCTTPPNGTVGSGYSGALTGDGGTPPYTWTVESGTLPPGLTLNADGTISGTPTQAGTFTFTVRLVDSTGLVTTQTFTMTIDPAPTTPTTPTAPLAPISSATLPVTG